ncbi:16S rRNA (cytosine(967)-C(5))-methyltransferase RsmB [Gudongella sp. SC589]|jgi:16S rRNA (cytosine967-C5)-methyltransferase|uniref:16S rRNA (cytosine(967)-C(5))-methyltransferase RsmB n=1 Tax=Gudongella sp. SC589 TaxID=3385990 RepID=UPI0039047015
MLSVRDAAIRVLSEIENEGKFSNKILQEYSESDLSKEDLRLLRELVYGVVENRMYIDRIIKSASNVKMKKIHPMILQILRIGVYQIGFMDRIPAHASINESVKLAKKYGHKGTIGYVNGVLRRVERESEKYFTNDEPVTVEELAIRYSHPVYLVKLWNDQYGLEFTKDLLKANNSRPLLSIRVNTLKVERKELIDRLSKYNLELMRGELSEDCIKVANPENITETKEFKDGLFTIQDESSMMVAETACPKENDLVLDVCSAPGGKATHIAQRMNNTGRIIARDLYTQKIDLVMENATRLGVDIIDGEVYDASMFDESLRDLIDICIVDAPCSGFGLLRRKPDIKFNRKPEDVDVLIKLQSDILDKSAGYVKSGGKLIYSTCTLNMEENLNQIKRFLDRNSSFKLEPIEFPGGNMLSDTQKQGYIELYPHRHGTDGFFIASMIKA